MGALVGRLPDLTSICVFSDECVTPRAPTICQCNLAKPVLAAVALLCSLVPEGSEAAATLSTGASVMAAGGFSISIESALIEQLQEENGIVPPSRIARDTGTSTQPREGQHAQQLSREGRRSLVNAKEIAALQASKATGALLLKREEEELQRVRRFTADVMAADQRQKPESCCSAERGACLQCYAEHPGDELQCSSAVQAYDACARAFLVQRHSAKQGAAVMS